ncbi:MAG: hypothetical protein Q8K86_02725, partial [Candidatus Nanopelagicaceae bacterium]|nr:hypothetical protein [Candidatus Nanopelagicaceae bacterium]
LKSNLDAWAAGAEKLMMVTSNNSVKSNIAEQDLVIHFASDCLICNAFPIRLNQLSVGDD